MKNSIYTLTGIVALLFLFSCNNSTPKTENETAKVETTASVAKQNRLEVYCFHGTRQCETCKNMKANTKTTLDKYFASQLKDSSIVFSIVDVDDEKNEKLAEKFQATGTALMINKIVNGKDSIVDWSDFAFEKANDADVFIPELKVMIDKVLK
ncbi:MAG: nitrophenyl compound nitroreductase subunit ArsF family protein [Bacteroidota bacterium]|nr:nitrophenyl compound nitroreductase subunit ArsF family protein [Bacteroidota bacterium]